MCPKEARKRKRMRRRKIYQTHLWLKQKRRRLYGDDAQFGGAPNQRPTILLQDGACHVWWVGAKIEKHNTNMRKTFWFSFECDLNVSHAVRMLYDSLECSKNAAGIHFMCRCIFFHFECTSKVLNTHRTFRPVARMCPNVCSAHEIPTECLECTLTVQECTTNADSDGILAHSKSRVTRVIETTHSSDQSPRWEFEASEHTATQKQTDRHAHRYIQTDMHWQNIHTDINTPLHKSGSERLSKKFWWQATFRSSNRQLLRVDGTVQNARLLH